MVTAGPAGRIDDNRLEALAPHHGSHAAAPGIACGVLLHIVEGDAGVRIAELPGRADGGDVRLVSKTGIDFGVDLVEISSGVLIRRQEGDLGFSIDDGDMCHPVGVVILRFPLDDERLDAHLGHGGSPPAACICLLDASRQRRLGAHGQSG